MSSKRRIVIVDDEPLTRMDIKEMLQENGYDVVGEGRNGEEAVELSYKLRPNLVIMDVKMAKMDGIKASSIISSCTDTAILLLTAYSQKELVADARNVGVSAYLVKPVTEEDLLPAVEIALSQNRMVQSLKNDIRGLKQTIEERKIIEKVKGHVMAELVCNEEDAYQWMRGESMKQRLTMVELAHRIIDGRQRIHH
ncbi:MAG: response regulator [Paenibacillaceae bacterium]